MMEKRIWIKPVTTVEQFTANEYIAACGDTNRVYKFICDAPSGTLYYYRRSDGQIDGEYNGWGSATRLGNYNPCDVVHEASTTAEFYDGFVDRNRNGRHDSGEGVIVWRGVYNNNGHATKQLNMDEWETTKS